jgi:hypothetical protein
VREGEDGKRTAQLSADRRLHAETAATAGRVMDLILVSS